MPELPTGTVTFLFTDIEGSTRLWEEHPRAMQAALARHDVLVREAIESNGGHVFKTVGDAFYAVFPFAPGALLAAIEAQRGLHSVDWDTVTPIRARIALHTGAAELRDGDYFGPPLNRVARLLSSAHGGQILLSFATQELVKKNLPSGVELRDLGAGGLKGLSRPEYIFQVVVRGLPSEFPPLRIIETKVDGTQEARVRNEQSGYMPLTNPYKGLRAFHEGDAGDFFGREALTARLLARMDEPHELYRFLAVVGPSGSGKSSVVRAGLVPALRRGALPGSQRWLIVEMIPGARPMRELAAVISRVTAVDASGENDGVEGIAAELQSDREGLIRVVNRILPADERVELALVVDQFEEVFTLVEDERARIHFLNSLYSAVTHPESRVRTIVTLRADFYDRPLLYPNPAALVQQRAEVVVPLSAEELEQAIARPAERLGVKVERDLVTTILEDVNEQPGTLPLMQYALTELFDRRELKGGLTLRAYRASGSVQGALTRRADEIYEGLNNTERAEARQLFLRLVTLGEGVEDTRRRVRMSELESAARDGTALKRVIEAFGQHRLLTFDRDPVSREPTVEVAHEALIRSWGRVREWLDASREDLRIHRQMLAATSDWTASGHDRSFLAGGVRLAQFEALAEAEAGEASLALTAEEREFVQASVQERDRLAVAERERQAKELALEKRSSSRLRMLVGGLAAFLVVAAGLTVWALNQSQVAQANAVRADWSAATAVANQNEAENQRALAVKSEATVEANLTRSEAQRLAAQASTLVQAGQFPEAAALLGLRSMNTLYTPEGDAALLQITTLQFPVREFAASNLGLNDVAYSPDGRYVLTSVGRPDNKAQLWDAQTGEVVREFTHPDGVISGTFSPDGKYVLTGSRDQIARLWELQTGNEIRQFLGHTDRIISTVFSPDSRWIVTGSWDMTIRLWDVQTGGEIRQFLGHTDRIISLAFSPDSRWIVTSARDKTARLWDVQTGQQVRAFVGHTDIVEGIAFSPDGKEVLTGSWDRTARLWDAQTGEALGTLTGHKDWVIGVAFSKDGKQIATSGSDATARLWDPATRTEVNRFIGHNPMITVVFSPDGQYVVTGSGDGFARLWAARSPPLVPLLAHMDSLADVKYSPDGKWLLTADYSDDNARLWDATTGMELRQFASHPEGVWCLAVSPDSKVVVTVGESPDSTVRLWDAQTGKEIRQYNLEFLPGPGLTFSPDGKWLLMGGNDNAGHILDVGSGQEVRRFTGHSDAVWRAAFSPDGRLAVTASLDKTARIWDTQTGKEVRTLAGHTSIVDSAVFSPDGKMVLTASDDGTARLWDAQTGQEIRRFVGHAGQVFFADFSSDGKWIATGGDDNTARMWDVQTGEEIRRFVGHTAGIGALAFSPDGKHIATASVDFTARIWPTDYHEAVNYLCARVPRDFTDEERAQYEIKDNEPTCPKQ
jgi:WD40 repeat protein/class 3 adenylate cyclase